ncbi:putative dimeric dihydrodiol dehydrogenase [Penicillium brasilianum]|uniref:D-xylose 1-dehydrogenase (NADP(+), D-xylono-1,5-lactone-forming) n=1 Tax=Penicillium brasilianum TaxID=104259 RepID=A0A1S9RV96_PENBI|nr:putative dimeric dihydrodiol dehydrogenase [Penicillium brasilianum]
MTVTELPTIRWGIIATGMISSWFVEDLVLEWEGVKVKHIIQAIGSSSLQKGQYFAAKYCPKQNPRIYDSYGKLYQDDEVDIVYIGTPHGYHYRDCMEAIAAGKNVLCEKAFTLNAKQAKEIFEAAREKNVYVAEAMWLRHRPLYIELKRLLHEEKVIGDVFRANCDFASDIGLATLPATSRYRDLSLGAGSLLDIGVYSLTWMMLGLNDRPAGQGEKPNILAAQSHEDGIEVTTSAILQYPSTNRQGIVTATNKASAPPGEVFAVIHGTEGFVEVEGRAPSIPESFTVYPKQKDWAADRCLYKREKWQGQRHEYAPIGRGFVYEAQNTALDILAGRKESSIMPGAETIYIMEIMDEIRRQGETVYPGE